MNQAVVNTLNDPQLLAARQYHLDRLARLYAGEEPESPFILSGYCGNGLSDPAKDPEKWVGECLTDLYEHAELITDKKIFRPLCSQFWFWGVHFTDMVFGAPTEAQSTLWWSSGVENEIGELPVPDLETNEIWKMAQRLAEAQAAAGVKLPYYTTQVLGEPWNQFFNIYGDRALYGFYDDPDGMKRDLGVVTDTLAEMHKWYLKTIPADQYQPIMPQCRFQPAGHGQMCGCSTHLVSHDIYEEFVRPQDERIAALFPHGAMFHLCGGHAQHLPSWREMPDICAYQLNDRAMEDLEAFFKQSRSDQILYLFPSKNVPVPKALEITEGGRRSVISLWELELRAGRFLKYEEALGTEYCV